MSGSDENIFSQTSREFASGKILSGKELFAYRKCTDRSVPQRGGQKEYAPDNSWLQKAKLETFYDDRKDVLSEERVERIGSLVYGEWIPERRLVELQNLSGKFWIHMGFVDEKRKWLYPEEALFLMETSILQVKYGGIPMSIHQAYACFMKDSLTLEEYQVYSHLRRLGYVVMKHEGAVKITPYVKKIKLHKYMKRKRSKVSEKGDNQGTFVVNEQNNDEPSVKQVKLQVDDSVEANLEHNDEEDDDVPMPEVEVNKSVSPCKDNSAPMPGMCTDCGLSKTCQNFKTFSPAVDPQMIPFSDFDGISLPDIGQDDVIKLYQLSDDLFCGNISCNIEKISCHTTGYKVEMRKRAMKKKPKRVNEQESYLSDLDFSYSEMINWKHKIKAKNWGEYKVALAEKLRGENIEENSPLQHLWSEDVTPLVKPEDAKSTARILEKLQVIKSVQLSHEPCDLPGNHLKISYDIHLPDSNFKKSSPGYPNHRVAVVRSSDDPPDLATIIKTLSLYKDNVPVNVAVVDNGELSFYTFKDVSLPVDISVG